MPSQPISSSQWISTPTNVGHLAGNISERSGRRRSALFRPYENPQCSRELFDFPTGFSPRKRCQVSQLAGSSGYRTPQTWDTLRGTSRNDLAAGVPPFSAHIRTRSARANFSISRPAFHPASDAKSANLQFAVYIDPHKRGTPCGEHLGTIWPQAFRPFPPISEPAVLARTFRFPDRLFTPQAMPSQPICSSQCISTPTNVAHLAGNISERSGRRRSAL